MEKWYKINFDLMCYQKYTTENLKKALSVVSKILPMEEPYAIPRYSMRIAKGVAIKIEKWYDAGKDGIIKDKYFFRIREDVKEKLERWLKITNPLDLGEVKENHNSNVKEEDPFLQYSGDLFDKDNPRWL